MSVSHGRLLAQPGRFSCSQLMNSLYELSISYVICRSSSALMVYDAGLVCRSVYHFFVFSFAEKFAGSCVTWRARMRPPFSALGTVGIQALK